MMEHSVTVDALEALAASALLLPDPVLVRDGRRVVIGCSAGFARLLGVSGYELRGRPLDGSVHPAISARFDRADRAPARTVRFSLPVSRGGTPPVGSADTATDADTAAAADTAADTSATSVAQSTATARERPVYRVRQVRHECNGRVLGWVATVRKETETSYPGGDAVIAIARAMTNSNYEDLRKEFPALMKKLARACSARGALVIHRDSGDAEPGLFCRWIAGTEDASREENDSAPGHATEAALLARVESRWEALTALEPLRELLPAEAPPVSSPPSPPVSPGGYAATTIPIEIYPVFTQSDLLGALVLIEPKRSDPMVATLSATLFAGLLVRRSIERLLNEYSADLEKRVKERTADLETAHDEMQRTQAELLQAGRMASVGQLAAGMAHEINNPTGIIKSNLGMLVQNHERIMTIAGSVMTDDAEVSELDRETREMFRECREGVARVEEIVTGLRDFALVREENQEPANINGLIENSLRMLDDEFAMENGPTCDIKVHRDFANLPMTRCCPEKLEQVFLHLLRNARLAMEDRGEIWISTSHDDDHLTIRIADTGRGMKPEVRDRVFEPFFTTHDVGRGTGLGLFVAWDVVRSHEGTITVESEPGKGSVFEIKLPIRLPGLTVEEVLRGQKHW